VYALKERRLRHVHRIFPESVVPAVCRRLLVQRGGVLFHKEVRGPVGADSACGNSWRVLEKTQLEEERE